jgi:uncharacterized membrane protein YqjE
LIIFAPNSVHFSQNILIILISRKLALNVYLLKIYSLLVLVLVLFNIENILYNNSGALNLRTVVYMYVCPQINICSHLPSSISSTFTAPSHFALNNREKERKKIKLGAVLSSGYSLIIISSEEGKIFFPPLFILLPLLSAFSIYPSLSFLCP